MEEKHYIINEFMAFLSKTWIWLVTIMGGIAAKISLDVLNGKKMSFMERLAVIGISFFGGYLAAVYCDSNGMQEQGKWIVPLATLFSETIIMWFVKNHKRILFSILNIISTKATGVPPSQVDEQNQNEDQEE